MTPNDIIIDVRRIIQDTRLPYRYDDDMLLGFVNQTIKRMVMLRPDLFTVIGAIDTAQDVPEQMLPATAVRLVEIFRTAGHAAIEEVSRDLFDRTDPLWVTRPSGIPTKYMRHPRNPRAYFLYPRPTAGVQVIAEYVATPPNYDPNDEILPLPASYFSALVDGTVFLAESVDNEHVNSGRAKLFLDSFTQGLAVDMQSRNVTDVESGGIGSTKRTQ